MRRSHVKDRARTSGRRIVHADATLERRGRQLMRRGFVPRVRLSSEDEEGYLSFYRNLGARLFIECGGRIEKEVAVERGVELRAPCTDGLDVGHPRGLSRWARGEEILRRARLQHGLRGCELVLLLPHRVQQRIHHAVIGALGETAAGPAGTGLSQIAAVEGRYVISRGGRAAVLMERAYDRSGSHRSLQIEVRLSGLF